MQFLYVHGLVTCSRLNVRISVLSKIWTSAKLLKPDMDKCKFAQKNSLSFLKSAKNLPKFPQ